MSPLAVSTESARELEVRRRRAGAAHPDACPKLRLHGVAFAVPARGLRVVPRFDGPAVRADVVGLDDDDPGVRLLTLAKAVAGPRCRWCGGPTRAALELEARHDAAFLAECFALARRLLLQQYELSDAELTELLSFPAGAGPAWIADLLRWAAAAGGADDDAPARKRRRWWRRDAP